MAAGMGTKVHKVTPRKLRDPWKGDVAAKDESTESAVSLEQQQKGLSYGKMF